MLAVPVGFFGHPRFTSYPSTEIAVEGTPPASFAGEKKIELFQLNPVDMLNPVDI
jgi:hypothetical protein